MAKLDLNDVGNILTATATINANNARIEAAMEKTLSRDGTSPNEMNADLDMNNNRLYNLPRGESPTEPVRVMDIPDYLAPIVNPGLAQISTRSQAEAGVDNTTLMTPLRSRQALTANRGFITPEDFGAVSGLAVDCTSALLAMRDEAELNKRPIMITGQYLCRNEIVFNSCPVIEGFAPGFSQIVWDASSVSTGIKVILPASSSNALQISNLSLIRDGVRANGTALLVDGSAQITGGILQTGTLHRAIIENVNVHGSSVSLASWETGIKLTSVYGPSFKNVFVRGSYILDTVPPRVGFAILDPCTGIRVEGPGAPAEISLLFVRIFTCEYAFDCYDSEGVGVYFPNFVQVGTGIRFRTAGGFKPQLVIQGGHLSSYNFNIDAERLSQGLIQGVDFYQRGESDGTGAHIRLSNGTFNQIKDNTFAGSQAAVDVGNTFLDGIRLEGTEANGLIGDQIYQSVKDGVVIGSGVTSYSINSESLFSSITGAAVVDNATVKNSLTPERTLLATRSTSLAIPHSSNTNVTWESATAFAPLSWLVGTNPERLRVNRSGRYRVRTSLAFAAAASGRIRVTIATSTGAAYVNEKNVQGAGLSSFVDAESPIITLPNGGYVTIQALQTSGADLNLSSASWAQLEYVGR